MANKQDSRTVRVNVTPNMEGTKVELEGNDYFVSDVDNTGFVEFEDVSFGAYNLKVTADNYKPYSQNILINKSNNNPRLINVTLTPS